MSSLPRDAIIEREHSQAPHADLTDLTVGEWRNNLGLDRTMSLAQIFSTGQHFDDESEEGDSERTDSHDEDSVSSEDSASSSSTEGTVMHDYFGGVRSRAPRLYHWLAPRIDTRQRFAIIMLMLFASAFEFTNEYDVTEVNILSIFVTAQAISLLIGATISIVMEGERALRKICSLSALWHWFLVALLFGASKMFKALAMATGLDKVIWLSEGQLFIPLTAIVSFFVFRRRYGNVEWLALAILCLSLCGFLILRERCSRNYCHPFKWRPDQQEPSEHVWSINKEMSLSGIAYCLAHVVSLSIACVLAERIFKNKSRGLAHLFNDAKSKHNYWVQRVHLDFWTTLALLVCWSIPLPLSMSKEFGRTDKWFGSWTRHHYFAVAAIVLEQWVSGLVAKHFSSVTMGLACAVGIVIGVCIADPVRGVGAGHNWAARATPSVLLAIMVILAAIIFQTGRLNLAKLTEQHGITSVKEEGGARALRSWIRSFFCCEPGNETSDVSKPSCLSKISTQTLPILYILSNALQTELQNDTSANRYFVPQSLQVFIPLCGMCFAMFLTARQFGFGKVVEAFDPKALWKFIAVGVMQAATGALAGMAMGLGINSSLYVAMGKIYTPLSLLLGRFLLKRKYLWIEWIAVTILFIASVTLAMLDTVDPSGKSKGSNIVAILCTAASASVACLYSVILENLLDQNTPFIVNKVRLDFGAFLWSLAFLPLMGYLGVRGGRPDLAYWVYRPDPYWECTALGACSEDGAFVFNNATQAALTDVACKCGSGVFLGWGNWIVYAALAIGVVYSWMTGLVIQNFSTVMRSVFDGFPIVLLWFVITPTASRIPLAAFKAAYFRGPLRYWSNDTAKDLITIVNPISAINYIVAAEQVRRVAELSSKPKSSDDDA